MKHFAGYRRSIAAAFTGAMMATLMVAAASPAACAEPAPLPDKPFAEHRIVLQLSDNDPRKQGLVISVANNLLKLYDPDKVAIEGGGLRSRHRSAACRQRQSQAGRKPCAAQGVRFDVCLNTVDTVERETGHRPDIIPAAIPVQVGVGQILSLTENGYTLVRP